MLNEAYANPEIGGQLTDQDKNLGGNGAFNSAANGAGKYHDTIKETEDDATIQANATHFVKQQ